MGKTTTRSRATMLDSVGTVIGDHRREIILLATLLWFTFSMVALIGFDRADPTALHPGAGEVANPCGPLGALVADLLFSTLGYGAWLTFAGMVGSVLALAGRPLLGPGKASAAGVGLVSLLAMTQLALGPGDAIAPGGALGAWTSLGLTSIVGAAGAWLALMGSAVIAATVLFEIRWHALASRGVGVGEQVLPWLGGRVRSGAAVGQRGAVFALSAIAGSARSVASSTGAATARTGRRMARSLQRREGDDSLDSDWTSPSDLDEDDEAFTPASIAESTAVSAGPGALGEVQWQPTEESAVGSEVLGMFPALTPRPSTTGSRDAPTRPGIDESMGDSNAKTPVSAPVRVAKPSESGANVQKAAFLEQRIDDDGEALARNTVFKLPKLSLLDPVPAQQAEIDTTKLRQLAHAVEETLASFKVTGEVTDVRVGPVVTTFEFLPDKGISVKKVANLQDDLAMGLRALSVRIVAPIPGKGVVGIEIPSDKRLTIYLREMLASNAFRDSDMRLPVVLGKDVEGAPVVADLAKMPHLLVGGTTGSGKSVGVNGMLMSLLFRKTPEELRLLLVDPKKLEFKMYDHIPHLLHPVVTEPKLAAAALAWACREMDSRYELLARWDVRNISGYNDKVTSTGKKWNRKLAMRYAPPDWPEGKTPPRPEKLPYIVIVIDELADLMLVAKKEVEGNIARLTQMARACGIHLIVATQRPSVDVVTGLIKSNLPTRISFKLRSGTDSRTVLDSIGAEALLGRGDMLYLPNAGDIIRVHGAFASDAETERVLDCLRDQREPAYIEGVCEEAGGGAGGLDDADVDALFDDAVALCIRSGKASTSMIQRHLKIGYNRAARIVDQMEARGVVGPADGARPRDVLGLPSGA